MSLYGRTDSSENLENVYTYSALENVLPQAEVIFVDNTEAQLEENRRRGIDGPGWWRYFTYTDCEGNTRHKAELLVTIADPESNEDETQADDMVAADFSSVITITQHPENQAAVAPYGGIVGISYANASDPDPDRTPGTYFIAAGNYTTSGNGEGASFTVTVGGDGAVTGISFAVSNTSGGQGFEFNDTITVSDANLGNGGGEDVVLVVSGTANASATFFSDATESEGGDIYIQWQTQTPTGTRWTNITGATDANLVLNDLTFSDNGRKYRAKFTSENGADEVISDVAVLSVYSASFAYNNF